MTGKPRAPAGGAENGSVSLEMVVLAPAFLLFIAVLIVGGRIALAGQAVDAAARDAARQASIARTQPQARGAAAGAALASLAQQGLQCLNTSVAVDTSGFAVPPGSAAQVTATVTCVVRLSDLAVPGIAGSRTMSATAVSPLDTYRERAGGFAISDGVT